MILFTPVSFFASITSAGEGKCFSLRALRQSRLSGPMVISKPGWIVTKPFYCGQPPQTEGEKQKKSYLFQRFGLIGLVHYPEGNR
jgi:hypothetical protein